ncbi:MAG: type II toxin-antitoxin system RelE/ParE family toxin [Gammaproteobacteria bacterium]|nr:MAG: type II toxin-antitoxin system RelE/ParE family toxin [Gammaproteobacteria bacterium]
MSYILSNKAEKDLRGIYQYSKLNFGDGQAVAYLTGLEECLNDVANNPAMAHKIDNIRPSYKRYLYQEHAVYFVEKNSFIYVVRVLHQQMKASLHLRVNNSDDMKDKR